MRLRFVDFFFDTYDSDDVTIAQQVHMIHYKTVPNTVFSRVLSPNFGSKD